MDSGTTQLLLLREDVDDTWRLLAMHAADLAGATSCRILLWDAASERGTWATPAAPGATFSAARGVPPALAEAVRTGRPFFTNTPDEDARFDPSGGPTGASSVLLVPVGRAGRTEAVLYLLDKPGGFTAEDAGRVAAQADKLALAVHNGGIQARDRDRRVLCESLREVSRALVGPLPEEDAFGTVLDQLWRVVHYQAAVTLVVVDDEVRVAAARGSETSRTVALPALPQLRRALAASGATVLDDAVAELRALGIQAASRAIAAPIAVAGQVRGAILVAFDAREPSRLHDAVAVAAFADHAGVFLDAGAVLRRERQARARAAALARVSRLAAMGREPEALLKAAAPDLGALTGADRVVMYTTHARNPVLVPVAVVGTGDDPSDAAEMRLDLGAGLLASVRQARAPIVVQDRSWLQPGHLTPFADVRTVVILPFLVRDELAGAATLAWLRTPREIDTATLEFLGAVAQQVSLGVENGQLLARLAHMAVTDELTQLANRRRFQEGLRTELVRAQRGARSLALVMADLDHLKRINDTLGHPAGDAAIKHVADAFRAGAREGDVAARLGGEEFALLLPDTDLAGAVDVAERLRARLAAADVPGVGRVTASFGVAACPTDGTRDTDLVRIADARLYMAKSGGRNRVCASLPGHVLAAASTAAI